MSPVPDPIPQLRPGPDANANPNTGAPVLSDWLANLQLLAGRAERARPWWDASATDNESGSGGGVAAMGVPLLGSDHPARIHPGFKRYLDDLLVPPLRRTLTHKPLAPSPKPQDPSP